MLNIYSLEQKKDKIKFKISYHEQNTPLIMSSGENTCISKICGTVFVFSTF